MKITVGHLRSIIKEELSLLNEWTPQEVIKWIGNNEEGFTWDEKKATITKGAQGGDGLKELQGFPAWKDWEQKDFQSVIDAVGKKGGQQPAQKQQTQQQQQPAQQKQQPAQKQPVQQKQQPQQQPAQKQQQPAPTQQPAKKTQQPTQTKPK
ncbi:MAG: hypothetical protein EBT03_08135 [Betaproteobacteria bacterium]|nr:hypothetical protein [Betaproteobacteria bacterium]NCA17155.1 hypothetical protein [Betaproteobacteria bacterium]